MCGIVGMFGGVIANDRPGEEATLKRMADAIRTRGPDDAGFWSDIEHRIGLGHRRLSIVDLSSAGHQPMHAASGRYVIAFNGEIYNHLLLRDEMETANRAPSWRGHSDTETLLAGFDTWGIQDTLARSIGMFAIAIWDRQTHTLTLARDRIGEKPLYYGWQGKGNNAVFVFGSELKALRAHPQFKSNVSRDALCLQLRHNYIPAPHTIYEDICKLPGGHLLSISLHNREPKVWAYWSGAQVAEQGVANPFTGTPDEAVDQLEVLLRDAVRQQMMADVPLGAFLSGGVDSSTVVALMQAQSSRPIKTFSIGVHNEGYNEAEHAKAVAKHLGTDHTELYVTPEEAIQVIPKLAALYDEPFSDSSQIPTYLVSQLARKNVTVSLSGDAGDELFCGYNRYLMTESLWRKLALLPLPLRKLIARGVTGVSPKAWSSVADRVQRILGRHMAVRNVGDKLHKGAAVLGSGSVDALYYGLVSQWHDPASIVIDGQEPATLLTENAPRLSGLNSVQRMMALDMMTYLPDDILVKVDRAAMGVSLETRVPFLDHRVVEFAWRLPQSMKLRDGQTKWALRQVLYRYVPKSLIDRPKMGFGVPIGQWLRGPLRPWAESLLDRSRLLNEGYFNSVLVRQKWAEHLSGNRNWEHQLWAVLMFQLWQEHQKHQTLQAEKGEVPIF